MTVTTSHNTVKTPLEAIPAHVGLAGKMFKESASVSSAGFTHDPLSHILDCGGRRMLPTSKHGGQHLCLGCRFLVSGHFRLGRCIFYIPVRR